MPKKPKQRPTAADELGIVIYGTLPHGWTPHGYACELRRIASNLRSRRPDLCDAFLDWADWLDESRVA